MGDSNILAVLIRYTGNLPGVHNKLLVYGPGGYRFSDYFKLGMPLNLIIILGGSWWIPKLWPF